jgi:hypothetical protein
VGLFPQIVIIPMTLVFAWFYAAASIKRLHDRNKSGWWMIPFVAATGLYGQFGGSILSHLRPRAGTSRASWNLCRTVLAHRPHRMLSGGHD